MVARNSVDDDMVVRPCLDGHLCNYYSPKCSAKSLSRRELAALPVLPIVPGRVELRQGSGERGLSGELLPIDENCIVALDALEDAIGNQSTFISVMRANNETGVILPVPEITEIAKK